MNGTPYLYCAVLLGADHAEPSDDRWPDISWHVSSHQEEPGAQRPGSQEHLVSNGKGCWELATTGST